MSRRDRIKAIGDDAAAKALDQRGDAASGAQNAASEEAVADPGVGAIDEAAWLEHDGLSGPEQAAPSRFLQVIPVLCLLAVVGWSAFFVWAMRAELMRAGELPPREWLAWIVDWSIPCLLIGMVWLLAMRNSRVEAHRFAHAARLLSHESAALEQRVSTINGELSLAREFLASQSRDLDALGRMATERLSQHSDELRQLISDNSEQVSAIGTVSETALANMKRLREDLPVIANSARDVTNQIGSAGRTAHDQLADLGEGLERLEQAGKSTDAHVTALLQEIGTTLGAFDERVNAIEGKMRERFEALRGQTADFSSTLSATEQAALADLRERMANLASEAQAAHERLLEAGTEARGQIDTSRESWQSEIAAMLTRLDELDRKAAEAARERIHQLRAEASRFDDSLEQRDAKFAEEMSRRQDEFDTREAQASEVLAQRLTELDDMLMQRREAQGEQTEKLGREVERLGEEVTQLGEAIAAITQETAASRAVISEGVSQVAAQFEADRQGIAKVKADLAELTDASVRLLEIIQSGTQHSGTHLPEAIENAITRLSAFEAQAEQASALITSTKDEGSALSELLGTANSEIARADAALQDIRARLEENSEEAIARLAGLRGGLAKLNAESEAYAGSMLESLRQAVAELEEAARSALGTLETQSSEKVRALAGQLSRDAVEALERALRNDSAEAIGKFEQSAAHASGMGREVTIQLRDQLVKVNELTKNLEQRIARAREQAQEQVDNDFARRMALITDSLNSASIDIKAALSSEVSDTEWDAYLKGDRGIFTRRAVRLASASEAREITELYQSDDGFKANVNRYIHDFEAMLRAMLSTRDGNALSVTMLGSDMGKLYVTLAQAIERFRK